MLNAYLYVAHDGVPEENLLLKKEDSISETEMQAKKQKMSQGERLISKYNNYE